MRNGLQRFYLNLVLIYRLGAVPSDEPLNSLIHEIICNLRRKKSIIIATLQKLPKILSKQSFALTEQSVGRPNSMKLSYYLFLFVGFPWLYSLPIYCRILHYQLEGSLEVQTKIL